MSEQRWVGARGALLAVGLVGGVTAWLGGSGEAFGQDRFAITNIGSSTRSVLMPREIPNDRFNTRQGRVTNGPFYRVTVALRLNPLGLFAEGRVGFRHRLFDTPSGSILLKNTYIAGGLSLVSSPAFVRPGIFVEFAPLAILQFQAVAERVWWLGNFQFFQSWPYVVGPTQARAANDASTLSGDRSFSDAQLNANRDLTDETNARSNYSTTGWNFTFGGILQAKIGDVAIRSNFRGVRYMMDTRAGTNANDRAFYDPFYDALVPTNGWLFLNDTDVIYQMSDLGLNLGVRFTTVLPLYGSGDYEPGTEQAHDNTTMRLGPVVSYTFNERRHRWFNAPTVFVLSQWWLNHPYRSGNEHSAGLPMFVAGFSFRGDN